jgi:CheY-like chemotaxis protein
MMTSADARPLILIADDNAGHVELLRVALGTRYRVVTASNGLDAYKVACEARPDAVLLDLVMPVADGYTVVRKLRANPQTMSIPVVLVTGLDTPTLDALPDRVQVGAILRKPCHQGEIIDALKSVLKNGSRPVE